MEVYQINSSPYDANAYLVEAGRSVLIDVGMSAGYVLDTLSLFVEPDDIWEIILTHAHYDHWGGVLEVSRQTRAGIAIHRADAELLSDDISSAASMFGARSAGFKPDRLLEGGNLIDLGDGSSLEVFHTPGHTPGGICLYHSDSGSLFSGDTVFPAGGFGRTDMPGGDHRLLVDSLMRLTELDVKVMYPGHGYVTDKNVAGQIRESLHLAKAYL